ncbi:phosphate/phosphite/phosphonate ABC transporter substrate-binding protein [Clostridium minihomine]|uniref:phosphate/phosphite/phosphonate ABC transporter substrate-binding protein n=1 Tax=Clostridium minihomine TaxID=2045012 RepID=UPI000C76F670|nr:phosphate/phosphite/phosphonate ABC transporter substrate-binding protein [Clostridium minihomine]
MNFSSKQSVLISAIAILILQTIGLLLQFHGLGGFLYSVIGSTLILVAVYALCEKSSRKPRPVQKDDLGEHLFQVAETMGFDSQQLIWLSNDNIKTFEKVAKISYEIEKLSEQNAASSQEINASINEFAGACINLNSGIIKIEDHSRNSIEMLDKNEQTIRSIGSFILDLTSVIQVASDSNLELKESSAKINEIVDSIRKISSQTNLLALNATIEAARAGEAGRGFSVVAGEIRRLAMQTNDAISIIEGVVRNIVDKIETSNTAMTEIGDKMKNVDIIVTESSQIIQEINSILKDVQNSISDLTQESVIQKNTAAEIEQAVENVSEAAQKTHDVSCSAIDMVNVQQKKNETILSFCNKIGETAEMLQQDAMAFKKQDEIIFGVNPFVEPDRIRKTYVPILERVCDSVGLKCRTLIVRSYDALSESVEKSIIDIGWFSPFAYVNAHEKCGANVLVTPKVQGRCSYNGYIVARKDGRVRSLNDLKGKTFAYVDKKSASGYLYARDMIKQNHMNPDTIFEKVVFLGNHNNVVNAILAGEVDAGATYDEVFNQARADGLFTDELIIVARTEEIPKDALAARKDMPAALMEKLSSAFVSFSGADTTVQGFVRSEDKAYDIIRRLNQ